mmetsp:Transcript_10992/g.21493  ORF Transcript_10992/g.21493 Transcript_10992/m.21493 type:complete len:222 (+) Transcript_10992:2469-3134(+)
MWNVRTLRVRRSSSNPLCKSAANAMTLILNLRLTFSRNLEPFSSPAITSALLKNTLKMLRLCLIRISLLKSHLLRHQLRRPPSLQPRMLLATLPPRHLMRAPVFACAFLVHDFQVDMTFIITITRKLHRPRVLVRATTAIPVPPNSRFMLIRPITLSPSLRPARFPQNLINRNKSTNRLTLSSQNSTSHHELQAACVPNQIILIRPPRRGSARMYRTISLS